MNLIPRMNVKLKSKIISGRKNPCNLPSIAWLAAKTTALGIFVFFIPAIAHAYIDPGTTGAVFSIIGSIVAAIGAGFVFFMGIIRRFGKAIRRNLKQRPVVFLGSVGAGCAGIAGVIYVLSLTFSPNTGIDEKALSALKGKGKFIIIGVDGMDPKLTKRYMDQGHLPNLSNLSRKGGFKPLQTINPAESPVVWSTIATGVPPAQHQIYDFIHYNAQANLPELSLTKQDQDSLMAKIVGSQYQGIYDHLPKAMPFWNTLNAHNIPNQSYRWPMTFPAPTGNGSLSGLGTPDIFGGMGKYTLFTTARHNFDEELKGNVVALKIEKTEQIFSATLTFPGPTLAGKWLQSSAEIPFTIEGLSNPNSEVKIVLETEDGRQSLTEGKWSNWIPLTYKKSLIPLVQAQVKVLPMSLQGDNISIYVTPINIKAADPEFPISYPKELSANIAGQVGTFSTLGLAQDTNALVDYVLEDQSFTEYCLELMNENERIFWNQFSAFQGGLFAYVFDSIDRLQHTHWHLQDQEHPVNAMESEEDFDAVMLPFYQKVDRLVGKLSATIDPSADRLVIISDHGFESFRRSVNINTILHRSGMLAKLPGEPAGIDFKNSQAFAVGFANIYINEELLSAKGISKEQLITKIKAILLAERDPEFPSIRPIESVYDFNTGAVSENDIATSQGPEESPFLRPALTIGLHKNYRASWQTAVAKVPQFVFEDNDKLWSGDHIVDAHYVPGIVISNFGISAAKPSVYDIKPTILDHFSIAVPSHLRGKSLINKPISRKQKGGIHNQ